MRGRCALLGFRQAVRLLRSLSISDRVWSPVDKKSRFGAAYGGCTREASCLPGFDLFVPVDQLAYSCHPTCLVASSGSFTIQKVIAMKKIVPDPPTALLGEPSVDPRIEHSPFFLVRTDIPEEDALMHASLLLRGIFDTLQKACLHPEDSTSKVLLWVSLHSTELAKVLVDAVLDGMGNRKATA